MMRNYLIIPVFLITILLGCSDAFSQNSELPVGTVLYSILPPEAFLQENGKDKWMLLGGQRIKQTDSLYKTLEKYRLQGILTEENKLPDARGQFIRSMNHQGGIDVPNRVVGSPQGDLTKMPNVSFKVTEVGSNVKTIELSGIFQKIRGGNNRFIPNGRSLLKLRGGTNEPEGHLIVAQLRTYQEANGFFVSEDIYINQRNNELGLSTLKSRSNPNGKVYGGDSETRPKNIALYTYIKIN